MGTKEHWDAVHADSGPDEVSWWLPEPATSLRLLARARVSKHARVLDVGCGQAGIADALLKAGYDHVAGLDISHEALRRAQARLGPDASRVEWIQSDVRDFAPARPFDVWHDRAVFHFLTEARDRRAYADAVRRAVPPRGFAIVATFAPDGPETCSGLPVQRHDAESIARELGMTLLHGERETHVTPWGSEQPFTWALLRRP